MKKLEYNGLTVPQGFHPDVDIQHSIIVKTNVDYAKDVVAFFAKTSAHWNTDQVVRAIAIAETLQYVSTHDVLNNPDLAATAILELLNR